MDMVAFANAQGARSSLGWILRHARWHSEEARDLVEPWVVDIGSDLCEPPIRLIARPTVAGLIAFSSDPTRHLQSAYIEAAWYGGTRLSSDDTVRAERLCGVGDGQYTPERWEVVPLLARRTIASARAFAYSATSNDY